MLLQVCGKPPPIGDARRNPEPAILIAMDHRPLRPTVETDRRQRVFHLRHGALWGLDTSSSQSEMTRGRVSF